MRHSEALEGLLMCGEYSEDCTKQNLLDTVHF